MSSSSSSPVKVSIIGAGASYSTFHLPLVLHQPSLFTLHSVLERSATPTSSKAQDALPSDELKSSVKIVNKIDEITSDPEVELVIITTINDTHYEFSKAALSAGKHVLVEKPTCPTEKEVKELAEIAKDKGVMLVTYQNRRFDADFLTLQKIIEEGRMGDVVELESKMDRYRPVLKGGWSRLFLSLSSSLEPETPYLTCSPPLCFRRGGRLARYRSDLRPRVPSRRPSSRPLWSSSQDHGLLRELKAFRPVRPPPPTPPCFRTDHAQTDSPHAM
jgi:hypothetical protein